MKDIIAAAALKSASVYAVYITILVIAGELSTSFNKFMAGITGHHWITKSVSGLIFFVLCTVFFSKMHDENVDRGINNLIISVIAGSVIIFGFFLIHG